MIVMICAKCNSGYDSKLSVSCWIFYGLVLPENIYCPKMWYFMFSMLL